MKLSNEAKVGALVFGTAVLALVFAWTLGLGNPFKQTVDYYVTYNFAGGIEIGSQVRVSGIKVGKVEKIDFFVPSGPVDPKLTAISEPGSDLYKSSDTDQAIAPVRLKISVRKDAAVGVRKDSGFYINLAGIIGERYIEYPWSPEFPRPSQRRNGRRSRSSPHRSVDLAKFRPRRKDQRPRR